MATSATPNQPIEQAPEETKGKRLIWKRVAQVGVLFFLLKGIAWLAVAGLAWWAI